MQFRRGRKFHRRWRQSTRIKVLNVIPLGAVPTTTWTFVFDRAVHLTAAAPNHTYLAGELASSVMQDEPGTDTAAYTFATPHSTGDVWEVTDVPAEWVEGALFAPFPQTGLAS